MSSSAPVKEKTLQYQDSLPSLPVPPLQTSCRKYLQSVEPHLTPDELKVTQSIVKEFCEGQGKELQRILEEKAASSRNWLKKWWEDVAYLQGREPISCVLNNGGPLGCLDLWPPVDYDQKTCISRMAQVLYVVLCYWCKLYRQEIPIEKMRKAPLCMDQYYRLFSACRVPGKDVDSLHYYFKTAPDHCAGHVVVLLHGRIYKCQVLDEQMNPYSVPEIEYQLQVIVKDAKSRVYGPCLGALTAGNRTEWWKLREHLLLLNPEHKELLNDIQTSIAAVVFDEKSPCNLTEITRESILGDCRNRWFDKSYQLIVFANGTFACNMEHAFLEGIVEMNMINDVLKIIRKHKGQVWNGSQDVRDMPSPVELQFELDDIFQPAIHESAMRCHAQANKIHIITAECREFGKALGKQFSVHPDTLIQMALQLTYFSMYKRPAATYETAQTRQFFQGRTDTVRSCTTEALKWCKAMDNPQMDNNTKLRLLRNAVAKHNQLMKEACNGQGIDRHFLGLQMIASEQGLPTPKIFEDKAWKLSGGGANFTLSTSTLGFSNIFGSTAAMVENGYGAFYSISNQCINICVTDWKTCAETDSMMFYQNLCNSFRRMKVLLQSSAKL